MSSTVRRVPETSGTPDRSWRHTSRPERLIAWALMFLLFVAHAWTVLSNSSTSGPERLVLLVYLVGFMAALPLIGSRALSTWRIFSPVVAVAAILGFSTEMLLR